MCLILLAIDRHPDYPVVLAANRDEFHARPTAAMHWWPDQPILAGQDLQSGGTWLGFKRSGQVATVTNFRSGQPEKARLSRGTLPLQLLASADTESETRTIHQRRSEFGGFNLLASAGDHWVYTGSEDPVPLRRLYRGIYGLSNGLLQAPWPKVLRGQRGLARCLEAPHPYHDTLLALLADEEKAAHEHLPDTGVGPEIERFLSSLFIRSPEYGTRASTVATCDRRGHWVVTEQCYGPNGAPGERNRFEWDSQ
ncbi:NRDE family protein [Marinobacteraceae bacterium S3BR75-40.1]